MATVAVFATGKSDRAPTLLEWLGAWTGAPLTCCAAKSDKDTTFEVLPTEAAGQKEDVVSDISFATTRSTSAASFVAASPLAVASPLSAVEERGEALQPRGAATLNRPEVVVRSVSFDADHSELPELMIPDQEQPLISGHMDANFSDLAAAMFKEQGSPFTAFLCGELGCIDVKASPFVDEAPGERGTRVQRSHYRLPLPADIPEVVARLLGMERYVASQTFTRAVCRPGCIVLQQMSRTSGLLYSERMRVMNIHCFEAAPANGVAWRTYNHIVWKKQLPWTHAFLVKIIDSRVKSETKVNAPHLMRHLKEAVEVVSPQR